MRTRILAALLFAFPVIAIAQQPTKIPRIGYLSLGSAPAETEAGFKQELRDLGWFEGQNVVQSLFTGSALGQGRKVADLATRNRLPTVSEESDFRKQVA